MRRRITVSIDEEIMMKLRLVQANLILEGSSEVSFSKTLENVLKKAFEIDAELILNQNWDQYYKTNRIFG